VVLYGAAPDRIVLAGGGARSPLWGQIVADVFGLPVHPLRAADASAHGAAWLAGAGLGLLEPDWSPWGSIDAGSIIEPDLRTYAVYQEILGIFRSVYQATGDKFERLSKPG
jgi:sugar (pentulose or hexulose) kinase